MNKRTLDGQFGPEGTLLGAPAVAFHIAVDRLRQKNPRIVGRTGVTNAVARAIQALADNGQDDVETLAAFGVMRGLVAYYAPAGGY